MFLKAVSRQKECLEKTIPRFLPTTFNLLSKLATGLETAPCNTVNWPQLLFLCCQIVNT